MWRTIFWKGMVRYRYEDKVWGQKLESKIMSSWVIVWARIQKWVYCCDTLKFNPPVTAQWKESCRAHTSWCPCSWSTCTNSPGGQILNSQNKGKEWSAKVHHPANICVWRIFQYPALLSDLLPTVTNSAHFGWQRWSHVYITFISFFVIFSHIWSPANSDNSWGF